MIEQLRALIKRHCTTLGQELAEIDLSLTRLHCAGDQCQHIAIEAADRAHKVKGSSGTIGFNEISQSAAKLERYLKELGNTAGPITQEQEIRIEALFSDLKDLVEEASPEQSTLYDAQIPAFQNRK
ncbi:Hpt domain-containing protein [Cohaesibacter sp. ES.047]|uniref:Hpt domain-containing protein n=1 Tax=Cohaesibacter sp. ES.047 TaxID=1798205 RepID=UPI000BB7690A|nr:Hpt domain-containing protein [Cohaesibacter sp. ES.047]